MTFEELLQNRYSCRKFQDRPVSAEQVRQMAALAQRAPSWGNTQPWKLYAVGGAMADDIRARMVAAMQSGREQRPDITMPVNFEGELAQRYKDLGKSLFTKLGIGREDKEMRQQHYVNNFSSFGAPCMLFITVPKGQTSYVVFDAGAYVHGLCLAAAQMGLATIVLAALARFPEEARQVAPIPEDEDLVIGVALGYAQEDAPGARFRSQRVGLEQVLNTFDL